MSVADLGPVWKALADPTHRKLLDLLRAGPRTTGDLCESVARTADLSRPVQAKMFKTVGDVVSFATFHRGYHIGKICTLRALLGKPRLFE